MRIVLKSVVFCLTISALLYACGATGEDGDDDATELSVQWAWISGSDSADQVGVYGAKGSPALSNVPGGRGGAVSWVDLQGDLWLHGGNGFGAAGGSWFLNDLWKFDSTILQWTWISGSDIPGQAGVYGTKGEAAPSNVPGARCEATSLTDVNGRLWLFGGLGYDSAGGFSYLNDLWMFDPAITEWAWISGSDIAGQPGIYGTKGTPDPAAMPGGRHSPASWTDSQGRLWLFGGEGLDSAGVSGVLNDLWAFDPTTREWTWISGSHTVDQGGVYGTKGTAGPANVPGARWGATSWIDSNGKLWLFGAGLGYDSTGRSGRLNDLWKFDPMTQDWTWVSGSATINEAGFYGTKGKSGSANVPGAREHAQGWIDPQGRLWLFGGRGMASASSGMLNDLWAFDPAKVRWTWVAGSGSPDQTGVYGTKGVAASSNIPGAREQSICWIDPNGRFWLHGGCGAFAGNFFSDLWQFTR